LIAFLGGTFDPVHTGHLHAARAAAQALSCPVRLVLSAQPPHRAAPAANAERRWAMLRLACAGEAAGIEADDLELRRAGPSYTFETLNALRLRHGDEPLCWIIGTDAFNEILTWRRWREVLRSSHLLVLRRPGCDLADAALDLHRQRCCPDLEQRSAGGIRLLDDAMLPISASGIRALIAAGDAVGDLLPHGVCAYIRHHGLYARSEWRDGPAHPGQAS